MSESHSNSPEDLGSRKAPPRPRLTSEHLRVLRLAKKGVTPDVRRMQQRMALDECRRWNLVRSSAMALTPAGEKALDEARGPR